MNEPFALIAAFFSAVATALAAWATWRAPLAAAQMAERLRRDAEQAQERQRQKHLVFATLMQERAAIYSESAVRALNIIDVVFSDVREVREAWATLFYDFQPQNNIPIHVQHEHIRQLLATIARDIGLGDQFRIEDLNRVYLPTPLAQERFIRDMQRQQALAALQNQTAPAANTAAAQSTVWPPPPT
jgi:hypothetical protein